MSIFGQTLSLIVLFSIFLGSLSFLKVMVYVIIKLMWLLSKYVHTRCELARSSHQLRKVSDFLLGLLQDRIGFVFAPPRKQRLFIVVTGVGTR